MTVYDVTCAKIIKPHRIDIRITAFEIDRKCSLQTNAKSQHYFPNGRIGHFRYLTVN